MKTAGKKITYTKKPTKISKFEIYILNPVYIYFIAMQTYKVLIAAEGSTLFLT
jgi:hypothetical protein